MFVTERNGPFGLFVVPTRWQTEAGIAQFDGKGSEHPDDRSKEGSLKPTQKYWNTCIGLSGIKPIKTLSDS